MSESLIRSILLLYVLFNPFLMSVYLSGLLESLSQKDFFKIMTRASFISVVAFVFFAWAGEAFFTDILQVSFSSFLIFGGIIFLIIGLQLMFWGNRGMTLLKGEPQHISGAVAMPFMIGPGTVSASVIIGTKHSFGQSFFVIFVALFLALLSIFFIKLIHDSVKTKNEALVERYMEVAGRITALVSGSFGIDMLCRGMKHLNITIT